MSARTWACDFRDARCPDDGPGTALPSAALSAPSRAPPALVVLPFARPTTQSVPGFRRENPVCSSLDRRARPPLLVLWGRWDPSVEALRRDHPTAETHLLDGGHFALDEATPEIARLLRAFLDRVKRR